MSYCSHSIQRSILTLCPNFVSFNTSRLLRLTLPRACRILGFVPHPTYSALSLSLSLSLSLRQEVTLKSTVWNSKSSLTVLSIESICVRVDRFVGVVWECVLPKAEHEGISSIDGSHHRISRCRLRSTSEALLLAKSSPKERFWSSLHVHNKVHVHHPARVSGFE